MKTTAFRGTVLAFASTAVLALTACSSSSPSDPSPWLTMGDTPEEQSSALMNSVLDRDLPGCSAAIARDGQVGWADAVGSADLSSGTPLTTSTVFDFASIAKHVTGMAILVLVLDGEVALDAPASTYLPDSGPWAATTTIEQLLHHTSGLPDYTFILRDEGIAFADLVSQEQAMATLVDVPAPATPQPWAYSNSNYIALASIVESVSGESFAEFVDERLFSPEGSNLAINPLATSPEFATRYRERTIGSPALTVGWDTVGDGALIGTPAALAEWFDVMRTGLSDDPTIADAMIADAVEVPDFAGVSYGAGLFVAPDGGAWHTGGFEGHHSYLSIDADRSTTVSLVCNYAAYEVTDSAFQTLVQGLGEIWFGPIE